MVTRWENRQESVQDTASLFPPCDQRLASLRRFSARLGSEPLLVQASSGNTSVKVDGVLWVKASGKWLQDAEQEEMFVPLELTAVKDCLERNAGLPASCTGIARTLLSPSIETFLHAVVPASVVVHVHSVNTIAWAVRQDAEAQLARRLGGMRWRLIPYASSGAPLAREIRRAITADPHTNVFVLANHGLVVCGDDCDAVQTLLDEVEHRLKIEPRKAPGVHRELLTEVTKVTQWRLPDFDTLHALGSDPISLRIVTSGVLYPCQALFLGRHAPVAPSSVPVSKMERWIDKKLGVQSFVILEGSGVLVSAGITRAELAMLGGLAEITQRVGAGVPIQYLPLSDVSDVLSADGLRYKNSAERSRQ